MFAFGDQDIVIYSECNIKNNNKSNIGNTFSLPQGVAYNSEQSKAYLAGAYNFKVAELEVYKV